MRVKAFFYLKNKAMSKTTVNVKTDVQKGSEHSNDTGKTKMWIYDINKNEWKQRGVV